VPQPDDEFFRAYGQFPLVNLYVPFEAGAKAFLPSQPGSFNGSLADYKGLLPPSWREYRPVQQSFWAGQAGRSLFRIHGSGEAVDFFRGKDKTVAESYNWNPTIGCLSARELYNEKGQLIHADMPGILQALRMIGGNNFAGYLMIVEVPTTESEPVSLKTIETVISSASKRLSRSPLKNAKARVQKVSWTRSRPVAQPSSVLQKSVESSRRIQFQVAQLSAQLNRLGQLGEVPTVSRSGNPVATELKPLPIAY
jgi:hypothetical protein